MGMNLNKSQANEHNFIHNIKVLSCLFPNLISYVNMITLFDPILFCVKLMFFEI